MRTSEVTGAASELHSDGDVKTTEDGIWCFASILRSGQSCVRSTSEDDLLEVSEEAGCECQRAVRSAAPADITTAFEVVPLVSCSWMC